MKKRNILITLGLSLTLGLGVFTSVNQVSSKEVSATGDAYTLVGDFNDWNLNNTNYDLTDSDHNGIYSTDFYIDGTTNYECKIATNRSWDNPAYGFSNVLIRPTEKNLKTVGIGDNGNVFLWHEVSGHYNCFFRESDQAIFILPYGTSLSNWNTFYLLVNNDWRGDWSNPKINYWSSKWQVIWDHTPFFTNLSTNITVSGITGDLYSYLLPDNATGVQARKNEGNDATYDLPLEGGVNGAYFYYDEGDFLRGIVAFEDEAVETFSQTFLDLTDGYCEESVEDYLATLKNDYDSLEPIEGAQALFYNAQVKRGKGVDYESTASEAISRYVNMQEDKDYKDFLGLGTHNPYQGAKFIASANKLGTNTNSILVVVLVSSISLISLASFFIIRRRKEHN